VGAAVAVGAGVVASLRATSSVTGDAGESLARPLRRARLAPAMLVQRAAFSSMLRSVSWTLAGGVTLCVVATGREKLGARAPEPAGRPGVGDTPEAGRGVCTGALGGVLRGVAKGALARTGSAAFRVDGARPVPAMEPGVTGVARLVGNAFDASAAPLNPAAVAAVPNGLRCAAGRSDASPRNHPAGATGSAGVRGAALSGPEPAG
jgi:hypothetical protein